MPELAPSRSAPATTIVPPGRELCRSQTNPSSRPDLSRVYSAQHLDDVSVYHGPDHESQYRDEEDECGDSDVSEKLREEDDEKALSRGKEQLPEVQMGVPDTRDLEANKLEKKQSTRSTKDPNLVRAEDHPHDCAQGC